MPAAYYRGLLEGAGVLKENACDDVDSNGSGADSAESEQGSSDGVDSSSSSRSRRQAGAESSGAEDVAPDEFVIEDRPELLRVGPFRVGRVKAPSGGPHPWEARCPFHNNDGDPATTNCKKRLTLADEQEAKVRLLKWCLEGLDIDADPAAMPRDVHKDCNPRHLDVTSMDDVQAEIRRKIASDPPPPALRHYEGGRGRGGALEGGKGCGRGRGRGAR